MKWFPFLILAAVAMVLQTTLAKTIAIRSISPDFMLILAVYYALRGPWPDAAIAGWILGFLFNTQTAAPTPLGLYAFCYGAAAWGVIRVRQVIFRDLAIAQLLITFVFTFLVHFTAGLFTWWRSGLELPGWWAALLTALYTAGLAPYLHWGLNRLNRWTGLKSQRGAAYR